MIQDSGDGWLVIVADEVKKNKQKENGLLSYLISPESHQGKQWAGDHRTAVHSELATISKVASKMATEMVTTRSQPRLQSDFIRQDGNKTSIINCSKLVKMLNHLLKHCIGCLPQGNPCKHCNRKWLSRASWSSENVLHYF